MKRIRLAIGLMLVMGFGTGVGFVGRGLLRADPATFEADAESATDAEPLEAAVSSPDPFFDEEVDDAFIVSPNLIDFGTLHPGSKKTLNVVVRGQRPFQIDQIKSEKTKGVFEVRLPPGARAVQTLPLTIIAPGRPGAVSEEFTIVLGGNVVKFKARAEVVRHRPEEAVLQGARQPATLQQQFLEVMKNRSTRLTPEELQRIIQETGAELAAQDARAAEALTDAAEELYNVVRHFQGTPAAASATRALLTLGYKLSPDGTLTRPDERAPAAAPKLDSVVDDPFEQQ